METNHPLQGVYTHNKGSPIGVHEQRTRKGGRFKIRTQRRVEGWTDPLSGPYVRRAESSSMAVKDGTARLTHLSSLCLGYSGSKGSKR